MIDFGQINRPKAETEVSQAAPAAMRSEVNVAQPTIAETSYLLKQPTDWAWEDLRDYVIHEATQRFGPQIRDPKKEAAVFKAFLNRYGTDAVAIAQAAFQVYQGTWYSSPITVNRFCKRSDEYFADVILARLKG